MNAKGEGWDQRLQPRLSLCQEYRLHDPSLLIARERLAAMSPLLPKADVAKRVRLDANSGHRQP